MSVGLVLQKIAVRDEAKSWRLFAVLLVVAATLAAGLAWHSGAELRYPDEAEYYGHAVRINAGLGFVLPDHQPTAYRPPGYPYVISLVLLIWQSPLAAKLLNVLVLIGAMLMMRKLVARDVPHTAWLPPLLVCAFPIIPYTSSTLYPQIACMALLLLVVWGILQSEGALVHMVWCGLVYGVLMLIAPSFQLIAPIFAIYLYLHGAQTRVRNLLAVVVLGGCSAIAMVPWGVRNYQVFHAIVPVATNGGLNLLLGNSEHTRPNSGVNVDLSAYANRAKDLNEAEQNKFYTRSAVDWVLAHPAQAAILYGQKLLNYFNFRAELVAQQGSAWAKDLLMAITYFPLLAVAAWRLSRVKAIPLSHAEKLILMLYLGNAMVSAVFFTRIRFRIPFDGLLLVFVAMALGRMGQLEHAPQ